MNRKMNKPLIPAEVEAKVRQQELVEQEKAEARAKKNFNFVQIEKRALKDVRMLFTRNATAGNLLFILAEKMNRQNALVCSYDTLSKITNLGRTTLYKAIKFLKDEHWIQVIKVGTANAYVVNSRVFWQSYGDKKLTVFNAAIVASSDEQDEPVENWDQVELKHFPFLHHQEEAIVMEEDLPPPDQREIDFHRSTDAE